MITMINNYLPHWASEYSDFKSQYEACSIMIKQNNFYTVLPVRLDEDVCPYLGARWGFSFNVNKFYGGKGFWRHVSCIQNSRFAFAKKLYLESAIQLMTEYPDMEDITFGTRRENGVYPVRWRYSPAELKRRMYEIMERKLFDGFYIDEFIRVEFEDTVDSKNYKFYGVLDMERAEMEKLLYTHDQEYIKSIYLKKGLRYTLEECKEFFREYGDDILELGNQPRAYVDSYRANAKLFEVAKCGDFETMVDIVRMGGDLNAMDREGNTPFYYFAKGMISPVRNGAFPLFDVDKLDMLISLGANPSLYGIGVNARGSLAEASGCGNLQAVKYFLGKGVDPLYYPVKDEEDMCGFTAAEEAEAEYVGETRYRGIKVSARYNDYHEISKLLQVR